MRLLAIEAALVAAFIAVLLAMRRGMVDLPPFVLTALCALLLALFATDFALAVKRRRVPRALIALGMLLFFGGGLANWLYRLQGYVILSEVDAVPLAALSHLQGFDAGPLSDPGELAAMLQLAKCELLPAGDGFVPSSHLHYLRGDSVERLVITPDRGESRGTLRFHQGTFGYAPRLVITRNDRTIFDRVVPFTTRNDANVLSFNGAFEVKAEKLRVDGAVSLDPLDERMKGHVKLGLVVTRDGAELGRGELLPGHFAELRDGYRIGFAGVKKWSEIDISRRNYPQPMLAGVLLILGGTAMRVVRRRP